MVAVCNIGFVGFMFTECGVSGSAAITNRVIALNIELVVISVMHVYFAHRSRTQSAERTVSW